MRTHVRVHLSRIAQNYHNLRSACAPGAEVLAIVKANAYGHGAVEVVRALEVAGCARFAVACLAEGVELRSAGIQSEIVVLEGFLPGEEDELVRQRLTPVLHARYQVERWTDLGKGAQDVPLPCHLKVNTGMNRLGVSLGDAAALAGELQEAPGVELQGVATHLASAEDFEDPAATQQIERFQQLLSELDRAGLPRLRWTHFANSAGLAYRQAGGALRQFNLTRTGLALYGWLPPVVGAHPRSEVEVEPALEWRARVLSVQRIRPGDRVGYGGDYTAHRPTTIAAIGAGYGDGYRRDLSNRARIRLHGRDCPVVGRVSMDLTTVDVSDCIEAAPGDEAILLGDGVTAHELADHCGTIAYEILCGIAARVPRVFC